MMALRIPGPRADAMVELTLSSPLRGGNSRRPGPAALRLIQCLGQKGLDDGLTAHVEAGRPSIEFSQHSLRQVDVDPSNGPDNREFVREER